MGFLDGAGLAHLWGKIKAALAQKADAAVVLEKATYDPTGKAQDVFAYADAVAARVQPDWGENDENSPSYVKDRFGGYFVEGDLLNQDIEISDISTAYDLNSVQAQFIVGKEYRVCLSGTTYVCTATTFQNGTLLGNPSIGGSSPDTGEPFAILQVGKNASIYISAVGTYTLVITGPKPVPIDTTFLPSDSFVVRIFQDDKGNDNISAKYTEIVAAYLGGRIPFLLDERTNTLFTFQEWNTVRSVVLFSECHNNIIHRIGIQKHNARENYVTTLLPLSGGALNGELTLSADPIDDLHAATKRYVDTTAEAAKLIFPINVTYANSAYAADRPFAEIKAAYDAGKYPVIIRDNGQAYALYFLSETIAYFSTVWLNTSYWLQIKSDNTITAGAQKLLPLSGETMTGPLTLSSAPTKALHAATKGYVDTAVTRGKGVFFLTGTLASDGETVTMDQTWEEFVAAYDAGKYCVAVITVDGGSDGIAHISFQLSQYVAGQQALFECTLVDVNVQLFFAPQGAIIHETNIVFLTTAVTVTLTAAGWTNKTQSVGAAGSWTLNNVTTVSPAPESYDAYSAAGVRCTKELVGTFTFACTTTPTVDLTVNIVCQEGDVGMIMN